MTPTFRARLAFGLRRAAVALAVAALGVAAMRASWVLVYRETEPIWYVYTSVVVFWADAFVLGTVLCCGAALVCERRRPSAGSPLLVVALCLLVAASVLAIPLALDRVVAGWQAALIALYAAFAVALVQLRLSFRSFVVAAGVCAVPQSVVAIAQIIAQRSVGLAGVGEWYLDPADSGASIVWSEAGRSLRGYGLADHPNILGGLLAASLVVLLIGAVSKAGWTRYASLAMAPIVAAGVFVTYSRAAWLAVVAGVLAFAWIRRRQAAPIVAACALAGAGLLPFVLARPDLVGIRLNAGGSFQSVRLEAQSIGQRGRLFAAANTLFQRSALLGVGAGNFPVAMLIAIPDYEFNYEPVHNVPLDIAVETGLLGALAAALLFGWPLAAISLRRRWFLSDRASAAAAVLVALTVVGLLDYYLWQFASGRTWWFGALGLFAAAGAADAEEGTEHIV